MDKVNQTLYIPLYGKSLVSQKGVILKDGKAEEIWEKSQFPLKRKSKTKWLAYYLGMRSAVFDEWVKKERLTYPSAVVLHVGCGLDSRVLRVGEGDEAWFDVDLPSVIEERKRYYEETERYQMLSADLKNPSSLSALPSAERGILLLEGVSMYLANDELRAALAKIGAQFSNLSVLVDCYTPFAAKMSAIKNPVNDVGVYRTYGVASASVLEEGTGLTFVKEHEMTPRVLIDELAGKEKWLFKRLYAGRTAKKLYKLYEYEK